MKKYKYITIEKVFGAQHHGHAYYDITNNKTNFRLGLLIYDRQWKQYVFCPTGNCIFSKDCMLDIIDFITSEIK